MEFFRQSFWIGLVALCFMLTALSGSIAAGADLKKVRIAFPSYTLEQLPYQLAERRGYFKEEGLSPEFVYMRSTTIAMALASQNLLYSSAGSSAILAAVSGIDAKV